MYNIRYEEVKRNASETTFHDAAETSVKIDISIISLVVPCVLQHLWRMNILANGIENTSTELAT